MLRMKKTSVTMPIHATAMTIDELKFPTINPLAKFTVWVSGKTAFAKTCMNCGRLVKGKNVPLSKNMGVMNRKPG